MKTVKLNKAQLFATVSANCSKHRTAFDQAFEGYRKECIQVLTDNLDRLKTGNHIVQFREFPPEDHTGDYKRVMAMLDMSVDDVVELTAQEFQQYVQDDWNWKEQWMASNLKYTAMRQD